MWSVYRAEPSKPYAPLNLTVGDTVIADGHVSVTLHWLPPMQSDLPVSRYKASDTVYQCVPKMHIFIARYLFQQYVHLSVHLSNAGILSKRMHIS